LESVRDTKIPKSSGVTIKDVAEVAGVSSATVSYVVNRTGSVSEATRERVRAAIGLASWTPNLHARELAQCRRNRRPSLAERQR